MTILVTTVVLAVRRLRGAPVPQDSPNPADPTSDRPPSDYAAKTNEGFPNAHWSN